MDYVLWFDQLGMGDLPQVGGKNASLGEMITSLASAGVTVPGGFATTAAAYWEFIDSNQLRERIDTALHNLDVDDVDTLAQVGAQIRGWIMEAELQPGLAKAVTEAFQHLMGQQPGTVAVRSSATAEDLPDASFAGQQETLLNVSGLDNVIAAIKQVYASLYNDRAIAYRVHQRFDHRQVALSVGIQRMVRSDLAASGVMFTLDTESGFRDVVFITAAYGLGETVVQGAVNPDEFYLHKPTLQADRPAILRRTLGAKAIKMVYAEAGQGVVTVDVPPEERRRFSLTDAELTTLAQQAMTIEAHYQRPMDIEWGKDGVDGKLYILQARPETVRSRTANRTLQRYHLSQTGDILISGRAIGQGIGSGKVRVVANAGQMNRVQPGDVLVTDMTDPDWEPVMKRAAAIVTNRGGRTCHAAIIARELGVPAVVGCGDATQLLAEVEEVTVSCAEGDTGQVYRGRIAFNVQEIQLDAMPPVPFKIMMNVGNPDRAFEFAALPNEGVGLARLEFIVNRMIGIHPRALLEMNTLPADLRERIALKISGWDDPIRYFVGRLSEGISTLAAAFWPKPVIVRLSDFKSNEYANLMGGSLFEPREENPMLGYRGASRYLSPSFQGCFKLECQALREVRETMGFTNIQAMVPFVRTVDEAQSVGQLLAENGLERGVNDLKVVMMCELPANALLAHEFLQYFDGFSIGSNDLTQLTLGMDRDSGLVAAAFDERNPAVLKMLEMAITACRDANKYVGICGQGPSDHPDLARWLMDQGIESISLNPDTVVATWLHLAGQQVP